MKALICAALAVFGLGSGSALAQDNPGARAGQQLGTLLFGNPATGQPSLLQVMRGTAPHDDAYYDALMQRLNAENAMAEARQNQQEANDLEMLFQVRQGLETQWGKFGMPPDMAHAVAVAFTPSDSDDAVFLSIRDEAPARVGDDIRAALGARNYQLANQLLLGYLKSKNEEAGAQ